MNRVLSFGLLAIASLLAPLAHAQLSETTYNKYNQTAPLAAYELFNPPSPYDGNYLFAITANANSDTQGALVIEITWTDETGARTQTIAINGAVENGSGWAKGGTTFLLHNIANTPVEVSTYFAIPPLANPLYNVSVNAIGFW